MKTRLMSMCAMLSLSVMLWGCASAPRAVPPDAALFQDQLFRPSAELISADGIFALSLPMRRYIENEVGQDLRNKGGRQGLIDALYRPGALKLDYDATKTRTAAEAFEARSGNCLSLLIMTAAFAKHLDLPLRYQNVYVPENWTRSGDLYYVSGHVNLSLGRRTPNFLDTAPDEMVVDFLPPAQLKGMRVRIINERTVAAMYMNNRAVENLFEGKVDQAYWWARAAVLEDPKLLLAYNTLGVVYRRHGHPEQAERALRHVLDQEPDNTQALSNLVLLMKNQDRGDEVRTLTARLRELQPHPPYEFFDLGMQAMRRGDYQAARDLFDKEIQRSAFMHEFHFWRAQADYALGDVNSARRQMALAVDNSTTNEARQRYSAKLDWLRAQSAGAH